MNNIKKALLTGIMCSVLSLSSISVHAMPNNSQNIKFNANVSQNFPIINSPKPIGISDDYAKKLTAKFLGVKAASRMLHRVKEPLANQPEDNVKFTTNPINDPSTNWAGYVAESSNITGAMSKFTVEKSTGIDAAWAGVGGDNGTNLAQTGVRMDNLKAWYEMFPANPVYLFNVNNGDEMMSTVSFDTDTGKWYLYIGDLTTGTCYGDEFSFNPDTTTAEWIVETTGNSAVGNFNPVNFTQATWSDSNYTYQNINSDSDSTLYKETENCPNGGSISTSSIGSDGQSFTCTAN